jgi:hypothetical protein
MNDAIFFRLDGKYPCDIINHEKCKKMCLSLGFCPLARKLEEIKIIVDDILLVEEYYK